MFRFRQVTIEGFGHYVVRDVGGEIYNLRTMKLVKGWVNESGYRRVELRNGKKRSLQYIHRLVALAFVPNDQPFEKGEVNHLDRDRYNCDAVNLEWVTKQDNLEYRWNHALKQFDVIDHSEEEEPEYEEPPKIENETPF